MGHHSLHWDPVTRDQIKLLSGRAALSAFFLEELLQPPEPAQRARSGGPLRAQ